MAGVLFLRFGPCLRAMLATGLMWATGLHESLGMAFVYHMLGRPIVEAHDDGFTRTRGPFYCLRPRAKPPRAMQFIALAAYAEVVKVCLQMGREEPESEVLVRLTDKRMDLRSLAEAYLLVSPPPGLSVANPFKHAQRIMRELIIFRMCDGRGPWTTDSLLDELENIFDKDFKNLDQHGSVAALASQMVLAFGQIHDAGKDPELFHKYREQMFPDLRDSSMLQELQELYMAVSEGSPDYRSKNRKRKSSGQSRTQAVV